MNSDEYHYHCIAFDLGYLYLTLSDIRRSNQGQIGKNHLNGWINLTWCQMGDLSKIVFSQKLLIKLINYKVTNSVLFWGLLGHYS